MKKVKLVTKKLSSKQVTAIKSLLDLGMVTSPKIASVVRCSVMQVAAVKAHLTMGTYG